MLSLSVHLYIDEKVNASIKIKYLQANSSLQNIYHMLSLKKRMYERADKPINT